jgi:hypothetical protein
MTTTIGMAITAITLITITAIIQPARAQSPAALHFLSEQQDSPVAQSPS